MSTVIQVNSLSKQYRLGRVGRKTLHDDMNRWWHHIRGKENPYLKIGEENNRTKKGESEYVWALRDINFEVKQGEVLGIIGRNGAGKSTLLKILSKVTAPTVGNVKIKGRVASLLEVGTGFHPDLTGRDNIFLNGAILGMTKKEITSKFDEIVDFAGVERYIDTPVKRYSSGMYVRLAFAVAAHLEPEILIVDEVLAVGDAEFQKKCLGKMKDVSEKDGRTVLFVSHNIPSIAKLCNRAVILEFGKKVFSGDSGEAINYYLNNKRGHNVASTLELKHRRGKGMIQCTGIQILNEQMISAQSVKSGDTLNIRIDYNVKQPGTRQVFFRIQLIDKFDEVLFICNNEHTAGAYSIIDGSGYVTCSIPKLPLFGGMYYINVAIFSREIGLLDEIESAAELAVEDGDFFGSGKIPQIRKGMLVSHHWQLNYEK